tara:strand:+ start:674 stop:901 length:228 start_codon:yes stop_codon:yes gene_type:complete
MIPLQSNQHLFTIKEASEILFGAPADKFSQSNYKRTRRLVQKGIIDAFKDGNKTYITRKTLLTFIGYDEFVGYDK